MNRTRPPSHLLKAVLFDLDGTLLDSATDFTDILSSMLSERGIPKVNHNAVKHFASEGSSAMVAAAFADADSEQLQLLRKEFMKRYTKLTEESTATLFPGTDELLLCLKDADIRWGIVTNKPRNMSSNILKNLNLNSPCSILICPEDVDRIKPDPEPVLKACQHLNTAPENCVYIGDHTRDIESGRRAGTLTVAALYGYLKPGDKPETWGADFMATSLIDIQNWLNV